MENKAFLQKYAMRFGTFMGAFWIAKFILFPLGLETPVLQYLFIALCIYVPFLGIRFAKIYRDRVCDGVMSFSHAWIFFIFMYLFASLLTSVGHYIYFQFIDGGYITNTYQIILQQTEKELTPEYKNLIVQMKEAITVLASLRPIEIVMHLFSQNMLYCTLIAIPSAFFVKRVGSPKKQSSQDNNLEDNKE